MSELFLSLLTFAVISTVSPGGATTLATASGTQFGFVRSIPLIAGIMVGLAFLVGLAALGLSSVTRAVPQLELWLRIGGSLYLLFLALMIGRQAAPGEQSGTSANPIGFVAGLLLLWVNPKGWTMAAAAAGTYARLADSPTTLALILGGTFGVSAMLSLSMWCAGGVWLARSIQTDRGWRCLNMTLALLLAASVALMWV